MKDHLVYRIPGQEIVALEGAFLELDAPEQFEGFVVSDFSGQRFFGFFPGGVPDQHAVWPHENPVIAKNDYIKQVEELVAKCATDQVEKVVLSRVKQVDLAKDANEMTLFQAMQAAYPYAFCYAFRSGKLGTWVGATPETLLFADGNVGKTVALAGTKESSDHYQWEEKEETEQSVVTTYISSVLSSFAKDIRISERTELVAGPVKHLVHHFTFLLDKWPNSGFLNALHPTPAVSGFPKEASLNMIRETELHARRLYAGIIGWQGKETTRLFVNLRCAQLIEDQLYLYVGGGLTADSNPEKEWQETENKAKTILNLLQNQ